MRDAHKARLQKQRFTFAETNRKMLAVEKNPLAAYNNRDLLLELQRRGFKGELTITEVHRIDLTNFN